jgi:DNA-binding beta-propeller fold protein YncE
MSILLSLLGSNAPTNSDVVWADVSTATHVRFDTINLANGTVGTAVFFKPDGTKVYTLEFGDYIKETTLSTAWDISSHGSTNYTLTTDQTYNSYPADIFFSPNGEELYTTDYLADTVVQYSLSTGWDLSTASYTQSFSTSIQQVNSRGLCFDGSGTNMYIIGTAPRKIQRFTLSTAWDISTCSFDSQMVATFDSKTYTSQTLFIKPDGTKIFNVDSKNDRIKQWNLSTPYDISSITQANYDSDYYTNLEESVPYGFYISPDGAHMYITGASGEVNQYSL